MSVLFISAAQSHATAAMTCTAAPACSKQSAHNVHHYSPGSTKLHTHPPHMQALLDEWRAELARKPMSMSESEACQVLEYTPGEEGLQEEGLKAAYRTMARRYG